ncbi:MAG: CHASE domain-containing protein, partial [Pseudomonadota bacterium]
MLSKPAVLKAVLLAISVFAVILGVRAVANMQARADYDATIALHVGEATEIVASSLDQNFHALRDIDVVLSAAAAAGTSQTRAFHNYVHGTEMFAEFPALRGMAVFEYVARARLADLVAERNAEAHRKELGYPPLVPKALADGGQHAIITTIAPLERGLAELGADIMARGRAEMLREAVERRSLTVSAPFTLFTGETAVSLFRPFYREQGAAIPDGFVATALSTESFLEGLKAQLAAYRLEMAVFDAGADGAAASSHSVETK